MVLLVFTQMMKKKVAFIVNVRCRHPRCFTDIYENKTHVLEKDAIYDILIRFVNLHQGVAGRFWNNSLPLLLY